MLTHRAKHLANLFRLEGPDSDSDACFEHLFTSLEDRGRITAVNADDFPAIRAQLALLRALDLEQGLRKIAAHGPFDCEDETCTGYFFDVERLQTMRCDMCWHRLPSEAQISDMECAAVRLAFVAEHGDRRDFVPTAPLYVDLDAWIVEGAMVRKACVPELGLSLNTALARSRDAVASW